MASPDPVAHNIEASQRNQERFEAYFLALTFTLLALAVQTATFGTSLRAQDVVELVGWFSFLTSGLAGLSRAEWQPQFFSAQSRRIEAERERSRLQKASLEGHKVAHDPDSGRDIPIAQPIEAAGTTAKYIAGIAEGMERRAKIKYQIMRLGFVVGIFAIMVARGWQPLSGIVRAVAEAIARIGA